jgi:hypothetical protein
MKAEMRSGTPDVTPSARRLARQVLAGGESRLRLPEWYLEVTAYLLPRPLRLAYGLPDDPDRLGRARRSIRRIRRLYPMLPGRLRFVGPYQEAVARIAGRDRPDPGVRLANRLWIGRPSLAGPLTPS